MRDHPNDADFPGAPGRRQLATIAAAPPPALARDPYGIAPGYPTETYSEGDSLAVTLQKYIRIFLKRKWLILAIALVFVGMGTLSAFLRTPLYTSTVRIQIDQQAMRVVESAPIAPEQGGSDFQRTQLELLKSRAMAERVVSALSLNEDDEFFKPRDVTMLSALTRLFSPATPNTTPAADRMGWAAGIVSGNIAVRPVTGSRLVDLTFTDTSSNRAQRVANAYADAFVASNVDKRFEANSYAKVFLEDQTKQLKLRLEESEKALLNFAEVEKIVDVTDKTSIAETNLASANAALGTLISERIKNEQSWRQLENTTAINLPQLLSNTVIDGLRGQRNELKRDYEEKLETYKPSYPAMVEIANKIKEIDRQLAAEVATVKASLKAAYESSANQESEMKARIEELRAEVLELQKKNIRYNILKREVESNRELYNSLLQRYKEVDVASGVGTNNVFIVDRAMPPGSPSEPKVLSIILNALLFGVGAGLGLAYLLELFDDRVRTPEDVEQLSGLATLGIIPLVRTEGNASDGLADPRSPISEAYRSLATALQFATETGLPRSLVVTSAGPSEGKSSTALAIARHFATMGLKVLLVDADLRKPSLHEKLGQDNSYGLSNYLTGAATPPEVLQKTDHSNLAFIASGPLPPSAGDLLGGTRIFSMLSVGSEVFDLIVIDSPPLLGITDAQLLASAAASTVFIVGAGQTRKGQVQSALRRLQLARVTPIGIVLTKFDHKAVGYGVDYGYSYRPSAYSYGAPTANENADHSGKPRLTASAAE
jgi:succinoglycan biosynthesis transport protein ExoP